MGGIPIGNQQSPTSGHIPQHGVLWEEIGILDHDDMLISDVVNPSRSMVSVVGLYVNRLQRTFKEDIPEHGVLDAIDVWIRWDTAYAHPDAANLDHVLHQNMFGAAPRLQMRRLQTHRVIVIVDGAVSNHNVASGHVDAVSVEGEHWNIQLGIP